MHQVKGQRTVQDILRQLARELRLSEGSEHRLRLLGVGNGEINAVIERDDDAQRVRIRLSFYFIPWGVRRREVSLRKNFLP